MVKHTIVMERVAADSLNTAAFFDSDEFAAEALNALSQIAGVRDIEIVSNDSVLVTATYVWEGGAHYDHTDEHLLQFGLQRVWPNAQA
ncbi:hypothetical protein [Lysobacter brunescens]|uniref:Uncharacterized protein n=1 Tax=Lysobacter brunescens TaxID=262323 RepID=A0ABW2YAE5_9GAMM